jgi:hypothetical protein
MYIRTLAFWLAKKLMLFTFFVCIDFEFAMNFYFDAAKTLDRLDAKQGSIKGVLATLPEKDRKRTAALVIETLKCENETTF